MSEMLKKFVSVFNLVIPFLEPYPPWVKALISVWIILTAFIVICLLFCRSPKEATQITTEKGNQQTMSDSPGGTQIIGDVYIEKDENLDIDKQFISTLFFHKSDKKVLDEHYDEQYKFGGAQFDIKLLNFISNRIEQNQELNKSEFNKDTKKIEEFYYDLVFIKLFSRFFWMYADWWDIRINSVRRGKSLTSEIRAVKPVPAFDKLKWANFLEALDDKDGFKKLLSSFSKNFSIQEMTVPPKTKVDLIITSDYRRTLVLTNPFARVSISIYYSGGSSGLGDYRWLLGYDNKRSNEFWSEHFEVNCKAEFEKSRSGYPEMTRYKQWVETMFAEVQYLLDEKEQLKRAHEYRDLIKP